MSKNRKSRGSQKGPSRGVRICPMCSHGPANTKEDIIPQWARDRLKSFPFPNNQFPSELISICRDCNAGLGKQFENHAGPLLGPMLDGKTVVLSPSDQALIGAWIIKTNCLLHLRSDRISSSDRKTLRTVLLGMIENGRPPIASFVRIGRIDPFDQAGTPAGDLHTAGPLPNAFLHAVFSLSHIAAEAVMGDPRIVGPFIMGLNDHPRLHRIWPAQIASVAWPPPESITRSDVEHLRSGWQLLQWPPPAGMTPPTPTVRSFIPLE